MYKLDWYSSQCCRSQWFIGDEMVGMIIFISGLTLYQGQYELVYLFIRNSLVYEEEGTAIDEQ